MGGRSAALASPPGAPSRPSRIQGCGTPARGKMVHVTSTGRRTPDPDPVDYLVDSAASWLSDALRAWAADEHRKVTALAPLAVEHLGKAVLWEHNPVLLVPLTPDGEASLLLLATKPSLRSPALRTIGMSVLLARLEKVLGSLPIDGARRKRMVDSRNGAMHVGAVEPSRYVLLDALLICQALLKHVDVTEPDFFGAHYPAVQGLLDEKRTETGHRVAAKRARARQLITQLEDDLGHDVFEGTRRSLEARVVEVDVGGYGFHYEGRRQRCVECGSEGLLIGHVDVDIDVDWDVVPVGGGDYESFPVPVASITLAPDVFRCEVCRLELGGVDELREAGLPTEAFSVKSEELGPNFDYAEYIEDPDW